jgi:FkbM family methyltransferase
MTLPETIPEEDFVERYLEPMSGTPRVIQIGANEGRFEYAKVDGKDFLFDFLHTHPHWQALLIEPIPPIFDRLRENYSGHPGIINFLNCAITESVEQRALQVSGKDGKSSRLVEGGAEDVSDTVLVQCLSYPIACRIMNWTSVDFVKIDAEGYDERIVHQILDAKADIALPTTLMWEQIGPERLKTTERVTAAGYHVMRTGLTKKGNDNYLDFVAVRRTAAES